jgi:hypothetical protein
MLSREQELKLLHVERWLRGLPPEEGLTRLARIERALRGSKRPVDKHFVQVIVAWRGVCISSSAPRSAAGRPAWPPRCQTGEDYRNQRVSPPDVVENRCQNAVHSASAIMKR